MKRCPESRRAANLWPSIFLCIAVLTLLAAGCADSPSRVTESSSATKSTSNAFSSRIGLACALTVGSSAGSKATVLSRSELQTLLPASLFQLANDTTARVLATVYFPVGATSPGATATCLVPFAGPVAEIEVAFKRLQRIPEPVLGRLATTLQVSGEHPGVVGFKALKQSLFAQSGFLPSQKFGRAHVAPEGAYSRDNPDGPVMLPDIEVWATQYQWVIHIYFTNDALGQAVL
jgi:hypothetical protein